jgi:hypothetical protein
MRTRKLLPYCWAALLAGCVPIVSLHPLVTKDTIAFEEKLLGTWAEDGNQPQVTWEFGHLEPSAARLLPAELRDSLDKCYRLNIADNEGRKGSFAVCLVKLQDKLFLDIMPDRFPSGEQDPNQMKLVYNAFFFTPVHTFVRVSSIGEQLKIRLTDDDGFKKLVQADLKAVKYDVIDDRPVLTASPEELQAFVAKYAADDRLFPSEVTLSRKGK